jgi:hypothetical protein
MSTFTDREHFRSVSGRDNQGRYQIELSKKPDAWTDGQHQLRFSVDDGDQEGYVNLNASELIDLRDMLTSQIEDIESGRC